MISFVMYQTKLDIFLSPLSNFKERDFKDHNFAWCWILNIFYIYHGHKRSTANACKKKKKNPMFYEDPICPQKQSTILGLTVTYIMQSPSWEKLSTYFWAISCKHQRVNILKILPFCSNINKPEILSTLEPWQNTYFRTRKHKISRRSIFDSCSLHVRKGILVDIKRVCGMKITTVSIYARLYIDW